ncbi:hypothetical protein AA313_de0200105 [Arthrobotrys entomopaga]|nr:hypothetical protein AA313_de0200105 [Arthrobotrys entomopaga]
MHRNQCVSASSIFPDVYHIDADIICIPLSSMLLKRVHVHSSQHAAATHQGPFVGRTNGQRVERRMSRFWCARDPRRSEVKLRYRTAPIGNVRNSVYTFISYQITKFLLNISVSGLRLPDCLLFRWILIFLRRVSIWYTDSREDTG